MQDRPNIIKKIRRYKALIAADNFKDSNERKFYVNELTNLENKLCSKIKNSRKNNKEYKKAN